MVGVREKGKRREGERRVSGMKERESEGRGWGWG